MRSLARSFTVPAALAAGTGSGTVTHTAGALTANQLILGNGSDDLKTFAPGTAGQYLGAATPPVWRSLPYLNVVDYGAVGDGSTDDRAAVAAAIAALPAKGGRIYFPGVAASYRMRSKVTIPSKVELFGDGAASSIFITDIAFSGGFTASDFDVFELAAGTTNVHIHHLRFVGENNPFVLYGNNFSAAIGIRNTTCTDVRIEFCTFEDLIGFSVHNEGSSQRVYACHNRMINCANGLNINGDYSIQSWNYLENAESIEASGAYSQYNYNVIINTPVGTVSAMNVGGRTSAGAAEPALEMIGNVIIGSGGKGISVGDSVQDSLIAHNLVVKSRKIGLQLASGGFNDVARVDVVGNICIDCGEDSQVIGDRCAIVIDANTDGRVLNNYVYTGAYAGFTTSYGLILRAPGVTVAGNYFNAATHDLSISTGAIGTYLLPTNVCVNNTQEIVSTATLTHNTTIMQATTDLIANVRLHTDSVGVTRTRFAQFVSGQMEWGDGSNVRDTNLYRSAANVLKTDDHFIGTLSVRATAVAFASLPASPVEGMLVPVTNSNTAVWGATIAGGGANHVLAYYNGTNWTVAAA